MSPDGGGRDFDSTTGVADVYPLTPLQAGMLYHTLAAPNSGVYVVQYTCKITGTLDPVRFRQAWERAFERHEALRTAFVWEGLEQPLQVVKDRVDLPWFESDWRDVPGPVRADRLRARLREDRVLGFPLDLAPLVRLSLIRTEPTAWRFAWTFHHIVADGWSAVTLLQEIFDETVDPTAEIPTPQPFRNFVAWLGEQELSTTRAYWEHRLAGVDGPTRIAWTEGAGEDATTNQEGRRGVDLGRPETAALQEFARRHQLTLNTVVHGAWALALSRYSGETDVVYGTAVSGRPSSLAGVESMIGLFINSLPVRVRLEPEAELAPWLLGLQRDLFDMRPHEQTSLASIAEWTGVGASRAPFESVLVFESSPLGNRSPAEGTGLVLTDVRYLDQSNYPLALLVFPGSSMELTAAYDTERFTGEFIDGLLAAVASTLRAFVTDPTSTLDALPPPGLEERNRLLERAGGGENQRVEAHDVMLRFGAQVEARPDALAIVTSDESWTYADLAERVQRTSNQLRARGATRGTRVALLLDRSPIALQAILAVLDIGAAYVPIATDEPASRRSFLLEDAGVDFVLQQESDDLAYVQAGIRILGCDARPTDESSPPHASGTGSTDDLAYVLYTSGSSGRPKGVSVSRGNLAYSTGARDIVYDGGPGVFLLLSPLTFDSSVVGIFWTLSTGGTLVLPDPGQEREPRVLANLVREHEVTHTLCVPALWGLVLEGADEPDLSSIETVIVAGETCPAELVRSHVEKLPTTALYNEYGPTEGTVWATVFRVPTTFESTVVPLGQPIPGTRVYLLDDGGRLAPDGAVGEICISGPGLSQGYANHADSVATGFVPDPYAPDRRATMYRTGDLGRWSTEGDLLFLGRGDEQVKVRGRRVELGEIEAALLAQPGVREGAIVFLDQLVAYAVPATEGQRSTGEIRARLEAELPDYMVPSRFVWLDALPRGRNGKVDRRRLPHVTVDEARVAERVAPRTQTEEALASIWREVLGLDAVGVGDHFFEIGGHSLLAIRLLGAIRDVFSIDFPFDEFFSTPTIAGSASRIETLIAENRSGGSEADGPMEEFEI